MPSFLPLPSHTGQLPSHVTLPTPTSPYPFLSYKSRPLSDRSVHSPGLCSSCRLWMPSREPRTWLKRWGTRSDLISSPGSRVKSPRWDLGCVGRDPLSPLMP